MPPTDDGAGGTAVPFGRLRSALSRPSAFPGRVDSVECIQTHISAVFLVGNLAYKVKKPKDLGFLDFRTPASRRHYCHEEVRLNRRLAPGVYQGVVPVVLEHGEIRVLDDLVEPGENVDPGDVDPEVVDWAVRMVRLPERRTLAALIRSGDVGADEIERVARRVVAFHAEAEQGPEISRTGDWETVAGNHRENFRQVRRFVGETLSENVLARLAAVTEAELASRRESIEARAEAGVPRDTHGDLRLEHVYLLEPGSPGRSPGAAEGVDEVVIIDCVEFNERYRWADPVSDVAFLFMDLEFQAEPGLAETFARRYFAASDDPAGVELLPLYATYRDVVRGKVRSFQAEDPGLSEEARHGARTRATHHFLAGLVRLSSPSRRPGLVVVFGLPGVGKSTIARALGKEAGFEWIDTDRVRKSLATGESGSDGGDASGSHPDGSGSSVVGLGFRGTSSAAEKGGTTPSGFGEGIYSPAWTQRTYEACLERARNILFRGGRVLIEGSFREDRHRTAAVRMAREMGVPILLLECRVGEDEARRRLDSRDPGPSDADWRVHRRMARSWEEVSEEAAPTVHPLALEGRPEEAVRAALATLADRGLHRLGVPETVRGSG